MKKTHKRQNTEISVPRVLSDDETREVSGGMTQAPVYKGRELLTGPYDDYSGGKYTASGDTAK